MREFLYNLATDKSRGFLAGALKVFLFILSLIYGKIIRVLVWFYSLKPHRLNCKVISVGNITLGGTGKTVLVEHIARFLKSRGIRAAILTRGYKRKLTAYSLPSRRLVRLRRKLTAVDNMGDEPYMLQSKLTDLPVIVDADRVHGAKKAIRDYAVDTVILDDGFQQWKIKKDLDIVAIDSTDPFGNQKMLPRGVLREPLSSLKRAGIFILTKTNLNPNVEDVEEFLQEINPQALIVESAHHPVSLHRLDNHAEILGLDILKGKTVVLFCGIGDPDSFEGIVAGLGANIGLSFKFSDHHDYSGKDLENIVKESKKRGIDTIITTEKDAARLCSLRLTRPQAPLPTAEPSPGVYPAAGWSAFGGSLQLFLVLCIRLKITRNEEGLHARLLKLYNF